MSELLKKRYRVTIDFDLTANDNAIANSGNADDVKQWDLALLRQFIKDTQGIQYLATEYIALDMGFLTIEDYEKHLGIGDKYRREIFTPSIDALPPDVKEQWEAVKDDAEFEWTLEGVTDCFETTLVSSDIEEVDANEEESEDIIADTNQSLSFKELSNTLDKISVPINNNDIPLTCDPDDYPLV